MEKRIKIISIVGTSVCLSVVALLMAPSLMKSFKLKATNYIYEWDLSAGDIGITVPSPRDYYAVTPGGSTIYFNTYGVTVQETYIDFSAVKSEDDKPRYFTNFEEINESDELISHIRGIKTIVLNGSDEHIDELSIFVGEEGCHGSFSNDCATRENFIPISEMRDDVDYYYFFIENTTEYEIYVDSISFTYNCADNPSSDKYPFIYKASGEGEDIEYSVRFDTEYIEYSYHTEKDLVIPSVYNGYPVTKIYGDLDDPAGPLVFDELDRTLYIPDTITEIAANSFAQTAFNDEKSGLVFGDGSSDVSFTAVKGKITKTLTFPSSNTPKGNGDLLAQHYDFVLTRN